MFNILLLLSAEVLHKVVRYVCKQWYNIVCDPLFIRTHSELSSAGLLVQNPKKLHHVFYIETDIPGLKVTEIQIPIRAELLGSCDGNILLRDLRHRDIFHVMNLVTKEKITLPPVLALRKLFGSSCSCHNCDSGFRLQSTGISLNSSGHYKVVHACGIARHHEIALIVFTVGVDKAWRIIDLQLQGIPMNSYVFEAFLWQPRFIAGFLYWFSPIVPLGLVLDVDTETFYHVPLPIDCRGCGRLTDFFSTGTSIGFIWQGAEWRFWTLTDVKSGEWTSMPVIDGKALFRRVNKKFETCVLGFLRPAMFVNDDFWFYCGVDERFVLGRYNRANESIEYFPINDVSSLTILYPHVHTLLPPTDQVPHLPRDVLFNILLLLPAEFLHKVVRYVCKQWYNIVVDPHFIRAHHPLCSAGFLIQNPLKLHQVYHIEEHATRLKVSEIPIPFPARLWGSLNGNVLLHDLTNREIFHVMNLLTKARFSLPPIVGMDNYTSTGFALDSYGQYKVVHVSGQADCDQLQMRVFTVGVDTAWRSVDLQGICMSQEARKPSSGCPYFIDGFIYWFNYKSCDGFAMSVDSETIYKWSRPKECKRRPHCIHNLRVGNCLGMVKAYTSVYKVWKLTDVRSGEWTKVGEFNMREPRTRLETLLSPLEVCFIWCISLINEHFWYACLLLDGSFAVVRCNVSNNDIVFFRIEFYTRESNLHRHTHTLLPPVGF